MEDDYSTFSAIYDETDWKADDHTVSLSFSFEEIMGDTLYYEVGDAVFDIVIQPDSSLYWKSYNPKYGTEAWEKATIIPISDSENMVSYVEKGNVGVCWYNDFANEVATVSVFVGPDLMTFEGTVTLKHKH
ncbi:MAG: hypothetical protein AAGJ93_01840 [Bacteroidota bacterium]